MQGQLQRFTASVYSSSKKPLVVKAGSSNADVLIDVFATRLATSQRQQLTEVPGTGWMTDLCEAAVLHHVLFTSSAYKPLSKQYNNHVDPIIAHICHEAGGATRL